MAAAAHMLVIWAGAGRFHIPTVRILSPQRHMFVQGDKQSDPAALEHQQMNSDEVRVNIRRVPMAEMMNVEKTHARTHARTRAHTRWFCSKGPGSGSSGDQRSLEAASAMFGEGRSAEI